MPCAIELAIVCNVPDDSIRWWNWYWTDITMLVSNRCAAGKCYKWVIWRIGWLFQLWINMAQFEMLNLPFSDGPSVDKTSLVPVPRFILVSSRAFYYHCELGVLRIEGWIVLHYFERWSTSGLRRRRRRLRSTLKFGCRLKVVWCLHWMKEPLAGICVCAWCFF